MNLAPADLVFLSYSRRDPGAYEAVAPRLRDRLRERLWDDQGLRAGEVWDERIRAAIDRSALAVLVLGEGYFQYMPHGLNYILEQELPYLLERRRLGLLELLPVYWSPSRHFKPERPAEVKPFEYRYENTRRSLDLHSIQAQGWQGCLEQAATEARRAALQALAAQAEERLAALTDPRRLVATTDQVQGREPLTIELDLEARPPRRCFRVGARAVEFPPPVLPAAALKGWRAAAGRNIPPPDDYTDVHGQALYQLLFGSAEGDLFPRLAAWAGWDLAPGATAATRAVAAAVRLAPGAADPWPLGLPWHLTAAGPDRLAERGWTFETLAPGLVPTTSAEIDAEPPLLVLIDDALEGAAAHAAHTVQLLDRTFGYGAEVAHCGDLTALAARLARAPRPQILYAYAPTGLDLEALAAALGGQVPLLTLNLIGETPPLPPAALVDGRKVVIAAHAGQESHQARTAGLCWLRGLLADHQGLGQQRQAVLAFGPRVRLWSGCTGLSLPAAPAGLFRRNLIKLLLDRVAARRAVADEAAAALNRARTVLALVAAGTAEDHPELLPEQVWQHYRDHREAGSRDDIRRFPLDPGPIPSVDDLLVRFGDVLDPPAPDWQTWLDRESERLVEGDHLILSLEWRLGPCPAGQPADDWRRAWLAAWLGLGLQLARYQPRERSGVLLVNFLIVTAGDPAPKGWTQDAEHAWRQARRGLSENTGRFTYYHLEPLSEVPPKDIENFLEHEYRLAERHSSLDPYEVARWVHGETQGVFRATVDFVERLHDSDFVAAVTQATLGWGQS